MFTRIIVLGAGTAAGIIMEKLLRSNAPKVKHLLDKYGVSTRARQVGNAIVRIANRAKTNVVARNVTVLIRRPRLTEEQQRIKTALA